MSPGPSSSPDVSLLVIRIGRVKTGTISNVISETTCFCIINAIDSNFTNVSASLGSIRNSKVSSFNTTTKELVSTEADFFHAYDAGKTVFFSDGSTSFITAYNSATSVTLLNDRDVSNLAFSLDPTGRDISDFVTDATLDSRINYAYTLSHRFWEPLPSANIGAVHGGFMLTAQSNSNTISYSTIPLDSKYLMGYYYSPFQYMKTQDEIQFLTKHKNKVVCWCKNTKYEIPLSTIDLKQIEKIGVSYSVLSIMEKLQSTIGCNDTFAWCYLPDGESIVYISNEPGIRVFDGQVDSDNIATDKIAEDLKNMDYVYTVSYDPINGLTIWGKR
jgi:hypothetical protein